MNVPIIAHEVTGDRLSSYDKRYPQHVLDSLIQRNPQLGRDLTNGPVDRAAVSFLGHMSLCAGQHNIVLISNPGPTAGNIWVSSPDSGILFTGDSVVSGFHPPLSEMCLREWLASLDHLIDGNYGARLIVPGRGDLCGIDDLVPLASYLQHIEAVVSQYVAENGDRRDLGGLAPEIASRIPSYSVAPEWIDRQVNAGLKRAFDEILADSTAPIVEE
jgi:glyoxylase-like metal-dependent hydrolase (beta-lactamase superfamily II)